MTNLLLITILFSSDKKFNTNKLTTNTIEYDEYVINTGALQNYVSNSTKLPNGWDEQTFLIGRTDLTYPSMQWQQGGYLNNNYLFYGSFFIGYNDNCIRFSTITSNDFSVKKYDFETGADIKVSFSMTDEFAQDSNKVGVKCLCKVLAWENDYIDDFLIYEYSIINNSGKLLKNVYAGFHIDGDVSSAAGGSGMYAYSRDDMPSWYLGLDKNDNP
jgi:hypothetical protein